MMKMHSASMMALLVSMSSAQPNANGSFSSFGFTLGGVGNASADTISVSLWHDDTFYQCSYDGLENATAYECGSESWTELDAACGWTSVGYKLLVKNDAHPDAVDIESVFLTLGDSLFSYDVESNDTVDDEATDFNTLCSGDDEEGMLLCSEMMVASRMLYGISPDTQFGVIFDLGEFYSDNMTDELVAECADGLNATWSYGERVNFVADHSVQSIWWSDFQWATIGVVAMVLIETARRCRMAGRRKKLENVHATTSADGGVYGSI